MASDKNSDYQGHPDLLDAGLGVIADHRGIRDDGMLLDGLLDRFRRNFLAAAVDELVDAAGNHQEAIAIQNSLIARIEPFGLLDFVLRRRDFPVAMALSLELGAESRPSLP